MSTAQNAVTAEPGNGSATIRARVGASAIDKVMTPPIRVQRLS